MRAGFACGKQVIPSLSVIVDIGHGKAKTVVRREVIMTEVLFLMPHSPSIAHQTTIDSLECHYIQKKRQKNRCHIYL